MTVVVALMFLIIVGILAFALNFFSRSQRGLALHAYETERASQAARSGARAALALHRERLNDPADRFHKMLAGAGGRTMTLPDVTAQDHPGLRAFLAAHPDLSVRVTARLVNLAPLVGTDEWNVEKRGLVEVVSTAQGRGFRRRVTVQTPFRLSRVSPAPWARFTLHVAEAAGPNWNTLDGGTDGRTGQAAPLVLVNGQGGDFTTNGWVYLGGGRVNLNLARGESAHGEDFHLPEAVTRSVFFPSPNYALLHVNLGFYRGVAKEPAFRRFPLPSSFKSSALRLFGDPSAGESPSPTLVLGDVWRRYVQAAAVGPTLKSRILKVACLPWSMDEAGLPDDPAVPPFLILSLKLYQVYMSQIREEPYNRSYDYVVSGGLTPPPLYLKDAAAPLVGDVYPCVSPSLEMKTPRGETLHAGPLREADLAGWLGVREGRSYPTFEALAADLAPDPSVDPAIRLDGVVRVEAARTAFPERRPTVFTGRGLVIFSGPLTAGAVTLKHPDQDLVTLVVEKGDLALRGGPLACGVIVAAGAVRPAAPVDVRGFLAARTLDPEEWRRGGRIAWDPRFDPMTREGTGPLAFALAPTCEGFFEE